MKIAIIDDDFAVLHSLGQLLAGAGLDVCSFQSAEDFMSAAVGNDIACVVSDVCLPDMSGVELHQEIAQRFPSLPVVLITGHGDINMAVTAVKNGALDFIEKPFSDERIVASIRHAVEVGTRKKIDADLRTEFLSRIAELSPRQKQVMNHLVLGLSNKEIALKLGLSTRTVENYRAWVMERIRIRNLAELVRLATWLDGSHLQDRLN